MLNTSYQKTAVFATMLALTGCATMPWPERVADISDELYCQQLETEVLRRLRMADAMGRGINRAVASTGYGFQSYSYARVRINDKSYRVSTSVTDPYRLAHADAVNHSVAATNSRRVMLDRGCRPNF